MPNQPYTLPVVYLDRGINDCPAGVTSLGGTLYIDNDLATKACARASLLSQLKEDLDPLQTLGLALLIAMYEYRNRNRRQIHRRGLTFTPFVVCLWWRSQ